MFSTHSKQHRENVQIEKGCVIGRVSLTDEECIHQINSVNTNVTSQYIREELSTEFNLNCPEQHKEIIIKLLEKNLDILAKKDTDLTQTDTVKMKIDT